MTEKLAIFARIDDWAPINTSPRVIHFLAQRDDIETYIIDISQAENAALASGDFSSSFQAYEVLPEFKLETLRTLPQWPMVADDFDYIWVRLDPPVNSALMKALSHFNKSKPVLNDPESCMTLSSKKYLIELKDVLGDLLPPIQLCYSLQDIADFQKTCPNMVLKIAESYGGMGVKRFCRDYDSDFETLEDITPFLEEGKEILAMKYLNNPNQSDNRIIIAKDRILGVLNRRAQKGGWLCNITAGGSMEATTLSEGDKAIADKIIPIFKKHGIFFGGVDTLIDENNQRRLSEINVLNIGTVYAYDKATGQNLCLELTEMLIQEFRALAKQEA